MVCILIALAIGIILGKLTGFDFGSNGSNVIYWLLYAMLFIVGMALARQKNAFRELGRRWAQALIMPFVTAIGSIAGASVAGMLLGMHLWQAAAVGSGLGWYTLSAVVLSQYDSGLGAVAFMSNIIRESLALLLIPVLASKVSPWAGISIGGATAMDVTLPVITRYGGTQYSPIAFIGGVMCSILVPLSILAIVWVAGV